MKLKELREKPLKQRVIYFIIALIIWFFITHLINSSYTDSIEKAHNLKTLWILSGIVIAILWGVLFPKKRNETVDNDNE